MEFSLSSSNFTDLPFDKYAKDFIFVVNGKRYETSRFVADILSPQIRKYHFYDESHDTFIINLDYNQEMDDKNAENSTDYFKDFLQLVTNRQIQLDENRFQIYSEFFYQLGNFDEYLAIHQAFIKSDTASEKQSIQFLQEISRKDFFGQIDISNEKIHFHVMNVSDHFSEIDKNEVKSMRIEIIEEIVKQEKLKLDDEDELFEFIIELYEEDRKYACLFEYVEFRNVSETNLKRFVDVFELEDINRRIWESICSRLVQSVGDEKERKTSSKDENINEFLYEEGKELKGIIDYLTSKTGGNVDDNETINITSNSLYDIMHMPRSVVDYQSNIGYFSEDKDGSFLCFDFKDKEIQITDYTIKSFNQEKNYCHLKNWVVEVSKDGENWIEIDRHENDPTLNEKMIVATFNVQKKQDEFYRFIRIRQTGNSWDHRSQHFFFGICCIEFYGKLLQKLQ